MPFLSTRGGGSATGFGFGVGGGGGSFTDATVSGASTLEYTVGGIKYRSHAFLTVGNSATINFTGGDNGYGMLDIMCIAGGGGGGGTQNTNSNGYGGGGGAGGCILREKMRIADGNYSVTVGNGGAGNTSGNPGSNGGNSSIFSLTAIGGGGGGWTNDNNGTIQNGSSGGSGGGAAVGDTGGYRSPGTQTDGQGHCGGEGTGNTSGDYGGNGGGATEAGADGTDSVGMVARISGAQGQSSNGTESAGVGNSFRTGGVNGYAGGGTGFSGFSGSYGGGGGNSSNSSSGDTAGATNTGSGGGAGTQGGGGSAGGSGIVVVRYPIEIVNNTSDMAYLQNLSAGTHSIATTNGTGSMSLTIVEQDGRKWAKIPWGTESSGGINGGHWKSNRLYSVHTYGNHRKGIYSDSSDRWTNDIESQGPNEGSSQVIFNLGIRYQYCRIYCTEIQSHTASGSGVDNADWGTEAGPVDRFSADLSGGFGDHPGWITGWDFDSTTGEPRYKMVSGNQSSSAWIAGSTGGWNSGEAGNVTRSFTSPTINVGTDPRGDGLYKHDKVGLLIAGGTREFYRHNSGYFLIS